MTTRVDINFNVFAVLVIQASIFNWTYLRCNWRYGAHSMTVILYDGCQIQSTSTSLRYINSGHCQVRRSFSFAYLGLNIVVILSHFLFQICRLFEALYTPRLLLNTAHSIRFVLRHPWSITYQWLCSFANSVLYIQLNVSPLVLVICRQFDVRYTRDMLPNTAPIGRLALCQLWPPSYSA
jgi:hypothetical protein